MSKEKKTGAKKRKLKLDVDSPKGLALSAEDLENVKAGGPSGVGATSSTCCHCDACGPGDGGGGVSPIIRTQAK